MGADFTEMEKFVAERWKGIRYFEAVIKGCCPVGKNERRPEFFTMRIGATLRECYGARCISCLRPAALGAAVLLGFASVRATAPPNNVVLVWDHEAGPFSYNVY